MRLSTSKASTFLRCPQMYEYLYVHEREPRRVEDRLSYGRAWHELMEYRWKGQFHSGEFPGLGDHVTTLLKETFRTYCELYPLVEHLVECEVNHVLPLGDNELEVRFDALVRWQGRLYLVEHKTTSSDISPGSYYWERLQLDQQLSWYYLAAKMLGHDIDGVIYDVVRKPALRQTARETREQFTERCVQAVTGDPGKYFARELVTRSKKALARAENNFDRVVKLIGLGEFPQNPRQCFDWSTKCGYHEVCVDAATLDDETLYKIREKVA